jgi:hypothetical protein
MIVRVVHETVTYTGMDERDIHVRVQYEFLVCCVSDICNRFVSFR